MKLSLFSVSYAGLWGQAFLPLKDFLIKASKLGYSGVEIMCKKPHLYPFDTKEEDIEDIKNILKKTGLEVSAMASYTNFTAGAESPEVPFIDFQISYIRSIAEIAKKLNCDLIRVFTGYENPFEPFEKQWDRCVNAIRECCDVVKECGIKIGIQNHHDIAVDSKALLEFFYEVNRENLVLMVDAWSIVLRGEDMEEVVKELSDKISFTTVADYVILPRYKYFSNLVNYQKQIPPMVRAVPIGEGIIDYVKFFNILKKYKYDGWVSYEMCSPLRGGGSIENLDRCAKKFVEFMKSYIL